jgi:hypothetical protein
MYGKKIYHYLLAMSSAISKQVFIHYFSAKRFPVIALFTLA